MIGWLDYLRENPEAAALAVAVLSGILALSGVAIGGILTGLSSFLVERHRRRAETEAELRRWKREDAVQARERLWRACCNYYSAAVQVASLSVSNRLDLLANRGSGPLHPVSVQMAEALAEIRFLGPGPLVEAANSHHQALGRIMRAANPSEDLLKGELADKGNAFSEVVRSEFRCALPSALTLGSE